MSWEAAFRSNSQTGWREFWEDKASGGVQFGKLEKLDKFLEEGNLWNTKCRICNKELSHGAYQHIPSNNHIKVFKNMVWNKECPQPTNNNLYDERK